MGSVGLIAALMAGLEALTRHGFFAGFLGLLAVSLFVAASARALPNDNPGNGDEGDW